MYHAYIYICIKYTCGISIKWLLRLMYIITLQQYNQPKPRRDAETNLWPRPMAGNWMGCDGVNDQPQPMAKWFFFSNSA